jgi:hypothetical protein
MLLVCTFLRYIVYTDDGSNTFSRNIFELLSDYTATHPIYSSQSQPEGPSNLTALYKFCGFQAGHFSDCGSFGCDTVSFSVDTNDLEGHSCFHLQGWCLQDDKLIGLHTQALRPLRTSNHNMIRNPRVRG